MFMKGSRNRKLRVERLEDKHMLNGTVTAVVSGGTLILTGDSHDNTVAVVPGAEAGELEIFGFDGTLIKRGSAAPAEEVVVRGIRNIVANLGRGNDNLGIGGLADVDTPLVLKGSVSVVDISGNNNVGITNATIGGAVSIVTGAGDDMVGLGDFAFALDDVEFVTGPVTVNLGASINTGGGDNGVGVTDATIGVFTSIIANGEVAIDTLATPLFTLFTGSGADFIGINALTAKYATISTGSGDDTLTIDDSTIAKDFVLAMGFGDDTLNVGLDAANTVGRFAILNGGPGHDTLNAGVNNIDPAKLFIISFEDQNFV